MKDKNEINETTTDTITDTAMVPANVDQQVATRQPQTSNDALIDLDNGQSGIDLKSLPAEVQLQVVQDIWQAEAALESMLLPQVRSTQLIGIPFNILDAAFKDIKDKDEIKTCVSFVCEFATDCEIPAFGEGEPTRHFAGEQFTVLKGSNAFNDTYVTRFAKLRGIASRPINGMTFEVDSRYTTAGNPAKVLRKYQQRNVKAV